MDNIKRRKKLTRKKGQTLGKGIFILGLFIMAQMIFFKSDFLKLKSIEITGNTRIESAQIISLLDFHSGADMLTLPTWQRRERLEKINWVKKVNIKRLYPDKLVVEIIERKPVILVRNIEKVNEWYAADADGIVLYLSRDKNKEPPYPKLVIDDEVQSLGRVNRFPIKTALWAQSHIESPTRNNILFYYVNRKKELSFMYRAKCGDIEARIGELKAMEKKVTVFKRALQLLEEGDRASDVQAIDVRSEAPYVVKKPKPKQVQ